MATASFLPPVSTEEEETDGGTSSQFFSKNQQQLLSSSNTTNNVTNINDINPDALLKTIQGLMNSVSEMRSEVESLRNHVAEALGIMWRRSTNSETKTTRRFKVFRNKIKTMETAIRILQDRMNSSFMGGPQFNENYHDSIHRRNQNDDVDSPSSYFFSPSSHHSNGSADARRYQEIMQHYENNNSNNHSTRLSRTEAERRRAALQAARRNKKNKNKNHESDNDEENDRSNNDSSSRAPSGSPPPPSSSKSPNTLSPTSSPRHHLHHQNDQSPSKSPIKMSSPSSSPKLSAPTFIPILGSDVSLVSANNKNTSVSESNKQNSDDIFGGNSAKNSKNDLAAVGVIVVRVPLGSPLHSSGVQVGDRIVQVDGRNLNSSEEVVKLWQMSKKNIISQKNNSSITISVVPGRTAQKIQMEHDNSSSSSSLFSEFVKQSIQVALKLSLSGVKNGNDDDDGDHNNNSSSDMIPSPNSYHKNHHSSSSPHPLVVNQAFNGARANGAHAGTLDASGTKRNQSPQPTTPRWH